MARGSDSLEERQVASLMDGVNRESGLVLDRNGAWHHQGQPVTHERLITALHKWLDRDDETGRYILRAGEQWCFIEVEDVPYQVIKVDIAAQDGESSIYLALSDGTLEELAYGTLRQRRDDSLCCSVKDGRFDARFSRTAAFALGNHVEFDDDEPFLRARGRVWRIQMPR